MTNESVGYHVEIDRWISMFPLEALRTEHEAKYGSRDVDVNLIGSPFHLAVLEQLRGEAVVKFGIGNTVPADLYIFGLGEPARRDVTKVGGLPYRPHGKPWPMTRTGKPYTFLAQFSFSESHDIVGDTPAELLLIFARDHMMLNGDPEAVVFEWQALGVDRLVEAESAPPPAWEFVVCYGLRHRTCDRVVPFVAADEVELNDRYSEMLFGIGRAQGTKVGGLPGGMFQALSYLTGKFLCSLGSIQLQPDQPFPFVNHPAPVALSEIRRPGFTLMFGDMGTLYIFMAEDGRISYSVQW